MSILRGVALGMLGTAVINESRTKSSTITPKHDSMLRLDINTKIRKVNDEYQYLSRRFFGLDPVVRARFSNIYDLNNERDAKIDRLKQSYKDTTGMSFDSI